MPPGGPFPQKPLQGVLFTSDGTPLFRYEGTMVPEQQQHCLIKLQDYLVRAQPNSLYIPALAKGGGQRGKMPRVHACAAIPVRGC